MSSLNSLYHPKPGCGTYTWSSACWAEGDDNLRGFPGSAPVQMAQEVSLLPGHTSGPSPAARTPQDFPAELLLSLPDFCLCCCQRLLPPRGRTLYLSLLNFTRFLLFPSSSLSRSLRMAALLHIDFLPNVVKREGGWRNRYDVSAPDVLSAAKDKIKKYLLKKYNSGENWSVKSTWVSRQTSISLCWKSQLWMGKKGCKILKSFRWM